MTAAELEQHAIRFGGGLDSFYVRACRISADGASAAESDHIWKPMPRLDDVWFAWRKGRRRYPIGPGVFQIGEGPVRSLNGEAVLVLAVSEPEAPSKRGRLEFGELLLDGKAAARYSVAREEWRYADWTAQGESLTTGPVSYLGPAEVAQPGRLSRPSALSA